MVKAYDKIREQYTDTFVLMRLGDFLKAFNDDAKAFAEVRNIALHTRIMNEESSSICVPLAGVPFFCVEKYVAELVAAGHRVAVVEPIEGRKQS